MTMLVSSGFSTDILSFKFDSTSGELCCPAAVGDKLVAQELENVTFMVRNPAHPDVVYAVHEVEEHNGEPKTGAVSRWIVERQEKGLCLKKKEVREHFYTVKSKEFLYNLFCVNLWIPLDFSHLIDQGVAKHCLIWLHVLRAY
jgi:hypothetical protein